MSGYFKMVDEYFGIIADSIALHQYSVRHLQTFVKQLSRCKGIKNHILFWYKS